jgi:hypothetical protein
LAHPNIDVIFKYKEIKVMDTKTNDFKVYAVTTISESGYTHWADGLTMYIAKNGVTMKLNSEEVEQLVKALPQTIGGTY